VSTTSVAPIVPPASTESAGASSADRKHIVEAAQQFESMFLLQMLKQMRRSMLDDESEEPGLGAGTMFDTIDAELARQMSGQHGGMTPMIVDAMTRAMRGGSTPTDGSVAPGGVNPAASIPLTPAALPLPAPGTASPALSIPSLVLPTVPVADPVSVTPAGKTRVASGTSSGANTGAVALNGAEAPASDVTSAFGWRRDPFTGATKFHAGVDIRASYGRDVATVAGGTVVFAGVQGGYGQSVVIEHAPGLRTRYAHLSTIDVAPGQVVDAGTVLGKVGQSGRATGPHLHFEVLKDGKAVDPDAGGRLLAAALKDSATDADYPTGSAALRADVSGVTHED
jgi:hypothetical protein